MLKRIVSALVLLPLWIIIVSRGGIMLSLSLLLLSIVGLSELFNAVSKDNGRPLRSLSYAGVTLLYLLANFIENNTTILVFIILVVSILSLSITVLKSERYTYRDAAITIMAVIYITASLYHIYLIRALDNGNKLVWLAFIGAWATDTFAYFCGKFFGKNKLIPKVSPNKTVEGAIGGILGCGILTGLYGVIVLDINSTTALLILIFIGFITSIFSQLGDLSASIIKRNCNVKDYGNVIPGHGGILDRFDSILFTSPIVYYCIILFLG